MEYGEIAPDKLCVDCEMPKEPGQKRCDSCKDLRSHRDSPQPDAVLTFNPSA